MIKKNFQKIKNLFEDIPSFTDPLDKIAYYWESFDSFYQKILTSPDLQENTTTVNKMEIKYLTKICKHLTSEQILKFEDHQNRATQTIGDCLEYFLRDKKIELLCAYIQTDKPVAFFNYGINVLNNFISNTESTAILTHSQVHPAVTHLLNFINEQVKDGLLLQFKQTILKFVRTIIFKTYKEDYIISLFFNGMKKTSGEEKGEYIPFQILYLLLKSEEMGDDENYLTQLRDTIILVLQAKSPQIQKYLQDESDFPEILVSKLDYYYHFFPHEVELLGRDPSKPLNLENQQCIGNRYSLPDQLDQNHTMKGKNFTQFISFVSFVDECASSFQSLRFRQALVVSFFNLFLVELVQPELLNNMETKLQRTTIQFLIEIINAMKCQDLIDITIGFIFGFKEEDNEVGFQQECSPLMDGMELAPSVESFVMEQEQQVVLNMDNLQQRLDLALNKFDSLDMTFTGIGGLGYSLDQDSHKIEMIKLRLITKINTVEERFSVVLLKLIDLSLQKQFDRMTEFIATDYLIKKNYFKNETSQFKEEIRNIASNYFFSQTEIKIYRYSYIEVFDWQSHSESIPETFQEEGTGTPELTPRKMGSNQDVSEGGPSIDFEKGIFIKILLKKLRNFLMNSKEENLVLTVSTKLPSEHLPLVAIGSNQELQILNITELPTRLFPGQNPNLPQHFKTNRPRHSNETKTIEMVQISAEQTQKGFGVELRSRIFPDLDI